MTNHWSILLDFDSPWCFSHKQHFRSNIRQEFRLNQASTVEKTTACAKLVFNVVEIGANYITIDKPVENYEKDTLLFLYGKEIPDFKNVNYEALFVINMRATQEIYKRLKAIETWAVTMGFPI